VHFSSQVFDPRLKAGATESVPSDGGFLVPSELSQTIIDEALEDEVVRPNAWVYPMKYDTLKVPALQDNDHSSAVIFGGVSANWASEAGELAEQKIKMRTIQLSAHKLGMISAASNELLEDSVFESVLGAKLTAGASWHLDRAFLFGLGHTMPLGILSPSNPALITVPKEDSQLADQVVLENILKMYGAMAPRNRKKATWVFNDGLVPALYAIQNRVFNLAATEYVGGSGATNLFVMNNDGTGLLLGRPVIFSEKLSEPGDLYDALFCDFSAYAIGVRREMLLQKSWHAGFSTDESWYRLTCRIDGQPTWNAPLKLLDGTLRSPYVTLAARE
jgi:HK97 family phage major capsid protein